MSEQTPGSANRRARRRGPLNITRLKRGIVFAAGLITGAGSAITGLGAQIAFAPMLTWMLGFNAGKAQGTALRYALFVAFAGILGALFVQHNVLSLLPDCFSLFLGATVGAILAARGTPKPEQFSQRRIFQTLGIGVTLFVIVQAAQRNLYSASFGYLGSTFVTLLLFGLAAGILAQIMTLPGGMLLVPALTFFGGYHAWQAILLSLGVTLLAALLPAWGYSRRGLSDRMYGDWAVMGGLIGGFAGGAMLLRLGGGVYGDRAALTLSAAVAMFLCGRELTRLMTQEPKPAA